MDNISSNLRFISHQITIIISCIRDKLLVPAYPGASYRVGDNVGSDK